MLRPTYLISLSLPSDWWARNLATILLQICINIPIPLIHISFFALTLREMPNFFCLLKVILLCPSLTLSAAFCMFSSYFCYFIDNAGYFKLPTSKFHLQPDFFLVMLLMKLLSHQSWDQSLRNSKNIISSPEVPLFAQAIVIFPLVSSFSPILNSASHFKFALSSHLWHWNMSKCDEGSCILKHIHMCLLPFGHTLMASSACMFQTWGPNCLNLKSCFPFQH